MKNLMPFLILSVVAAMLAGCSGSADMPKTNTPEGAAKSLIQSMQQNQPDQLFALMPPTYQKDVNALAKEFATRMDAELWNGVRDRVARLGKVLKAKEAIILEATKANPMTAGQDLDTMLPQVSAFLQAVATSRLTDLAQLKKGDLAPLLAKDGKELMVQMSKIAGTREDDENPWKVMGAAKVELASSDDANAVLKVTSGEDTEEVKLKKVEGAWVPSEMATEWTNTIAEAKKSLQQIDFTTEEGQQMKAQANMFLAMADGIITQIEGAKTSEDMTVVMNTMMGQVMGMIMGRTMGGGM